MVFCGEGVAEEEPFRGTKTGLGELVDEPEGPTTSVGNPKEEADAVGLLDPERKRNDGSGVEERA